MTTVLDGASLTITTATDCPDDAGLHSDVSRTTAASPPTSGLTTLGLEPPYCRDKYRAYSSKASTHSIWTFFFLVQSLLLQVFNFLALYICIYIFDFLVLQIQNEKLWKMREKYTILGYSEEMILEIEEKTRKIYI